MRTSRGVALLLVLWLVALFAALVGGYLAARLQGLTPEASAKCGNKLASIVIQHAGAIIPAEAMPVFVFV